MTNRLAPPDYGHPDQRGHWVIRRGHGRTGRMAGAATALLAVAVVACLPGTAFAGATVAATGVARAEPSLGVSGLETAPGIVRFLLTAQDLPLNTAVDPAKVTVAVGETTLVSDAVKVSRAATKLPPRGLMVVLDVSGSVAGARLAAAQGAVRELAAALPEDIQVGLIAVSDSPAAVLAPTADRAALTAATGQLSAAGDTALYDAVALAATTLQSAGLGTDTERRVLVLSDGRDTASRLSLSQLQGRLRSARLAVDVVAFQADKAGLDALQEIAVVGGGRVLTAPDASFVSDAFRAVAGGFSVVLSVEAVVPSSLGQQQDTLVVSLAVADGTLSTSVPVTFAAAPPSRTAPEPLLGRLPSWTLWLLTGFLFVGVISMIIVLAWPTSRKQERIRQIEQFGAARPAPAPAKATAASPSALTKTALAASAAVVRSGNLEERIALSLDQAGMRLRPHEWLLLRAGVAAGGLALWIAFGFAWYTWPFGAFLGWLATGFYRSIRADRRARAFDEQLPDGLQLIIGSLRSGFSLPQAIDALVRESPEPIAAEFGRALTEHRLGADISDSLEAVARRTKSDDLTWAVMAVRIQREVGGNLAEVLQTAVDTIRERGRLRRHVRSLSAEGRLSAWVLIALPILLGAFMFIFRRAYLRPLYTEPLGLTMLMIGVLLLAVGIVWMSRVVKVEV